MASGSAGRLFSLDEVVAELDSMAIPGPVIDDEDWSDDDFDGYVGEPDGQVVEGREGESDDEQQQGEAENSERLELGGECEVGEANGLPAYSFTPGCNYSCDNATPLDFFRMLLTDDILDNIVTQTNLYAAQYISTHNLPPRSRVHGWSREPFTREELQKFIALIIIMGLVNLPTIEDHWVTTWPYSSEACSKVCIIISNT